MTKEKKVRKVATGARYAVDNPNNLSRQELAAVVRRASKAANQRLRDVEKEVREGREEGKGEAYAYMERVLADENRNRFKERTAKMTIQELRQEYSRVITYMNWKSSTKLGRMELAHSKYEKYVEKGYQGTEDDFTTQCRKLWSKAMVSKFGSDVIYAVFTSGNSDLMEEWMNRADNIEDEDAATAGKELLKVLRKIL